MQATSDIGVNLITWEGGDHLVVAAAKVSVDPDEAYSWAEEERKEGNAGLINYLMRHRHGSPFEHGMMTFFIDAPIFVWREIMRHRTGWSYNETSGRYRKLSPKFWIPRSDRNAIPVAGFQAARPQFDNVPQDVHLRGTSQMETAYMRAWESYEDLLDMGYATEVARTVLPVGIYSQGWATCNPRSLMHFLSLRTSNKDAAFRSYPQAEIEEVAQQMEAIFQEAWPLTYRAFIKNGRVAP